MPSAFFALPLIRDRRRYLSPRSTCRHTHNTTEGASPCRPSQAVDASFWPRRRDAESALSPRRHALTCVRSYATRGSGWRGRRSSVRASRQAPQLFRRRGPLPQFWNERPGTLDEHLAVVGFVPRHRASPSPAGPALTSFAEAGRGRKCAASSVSRRGGVEETANSSVSIRCGGPPAGRKAGPAFGRRGGHAVRARQAPRAEEDADPHHGPRRGTILGRGRPALRVAARRVGRALSFRFARRRVRPRSCSRSRRTSLRWR